MCSVVISSYADTPQETEEYKPDGVHAGHEYVDLGLPSGTLWATCNVGATSPYEGGQYFAWGEVEPRENFTWESYALFEEFAFDENIGYYAKLKNIGADISGTEYDAARYQWGGGWRLPNEKERYELRMLCWSNGATYENGIYGVRVHGRNEHSIFLPICGYGLWLGEPDPFNDTSAVYWTGVEEPEIFSGVPLEPSNIGRSFVVDQYGGFSGASSSKAYGLNVRAVFNPKESGIDNIVSDSEKVSLTYRNGYIHVAGTYADGMVRLYNLSGQIAYSGSVTDGVCILPELAAGIYIASYTNKFNNVTNQKIIIK